MYSPYGVCVEEFKDACDDNITTSTSRIVNGCITQRCLETKNIHYYIYLEIKEGKRKIRGK